MLTVEFGEFPILKTHRLLLRQASPADAPALFAMRSDERVMRYIGRPPQKDLSEAEQLIQQYLDGYANNEAINWALTLHGQPTLIGTIGFWKLDKMNHRAEIGYTLHADYWRQGIMNEAMSAALEYCFQTLNFHSVEANTDPENDATGRLLEKHGFVQEAYFRENFYFEGKFLDSRIYSKINPYHKALGQAQNF